MSSKGCFTDNFLSLNLHFGIGGGGAQNKIKKILSDLSLTFGSCKFPCRDQDLSKQEHGLNSSPFLR